MNDLDQFVEVLFYLEFSLTSFGTLKYDCVIKTIEMFNFVPLINNSVIIRFQKLLILYVSFLNCILQYFYKHLSYHLSIQ